MIVMKFGGTSVQYSQNMLEVINIINAYSEKSKVVVLSACRGITDSLITLAKAASINDEQIVTDKLCFITNHHYTLINELIKTNDYKFQAIKRFDDLLTELKNITEGITLLKELTHKTLAAISSFGERMSTAIFETACKENNLNTELIDSRNILILNNISSDIKVEFDFTKKNLESIISPLLDNNIIPIMQGFIGSDESGITQVLTRGGSDYSAAVFGALLNAEEIQIWTDVSGVYSADPRFEPNAQTIENMTFDEVSDLSFYGAKVLHPDTVKPAIDYGIPVRVLNTLKPDSATTLITNELSNSQSKLNAIVAKKGLFKNIIKHPAGVEYSAFMTDLYIYLREKNHKIYYQYFSPIKTELFCSLSLENYKAFHSEIIVKDAISVICLTGHKLFDYTVGSKSIFSIVSTEISDIEIESISSNQSGSIIITAKDENTDILVTRLHNLIIELNKNS